MTDNNMELFPIVDERGNVVDKATRGECHSGSMLLHPVVHLHVFNSQGDLYLQRRPDWKDIQPGRWDTAVGGHVDYGEAILDALKRETREELGIKGFCASPLTPYVFQSTRERELVNPFFVIYDGPITPSEETDGGRFWTKEEIAEAMGKDVFTPNFEQEYTRLFTEASSEGMFLLEVCCGDLQSVAAAVAGGADRVELCAALSVDGLTPSVGMIKEAMKMGIKVQVLIRPREGDFVYTEQEVACMEHDIHVCKELGVNGVVIGALTAEGDIDLNCCERLMSVAEGLSVTFHRAFDQCRNPRKALEEIIRLGCDRILTSGQASTALEGAALLRDIVAQADGRISIMPGAGVTPENATRILQATGAKEIHGSLRENGHSSARWIRQIKKSPTPTLP